MAKLFYTLEEAAQKLHKTTEEVMAMARSGQLQELKDKDNVLFRRSAIDQLASEDDSSEINLDNFDAGSSGSDIRLGGSSMGGDELRLDAPTAASGADDSMMDELASPGGSPGGSGAINLDDSIGLSDSSARSGPARPAARPNVNTSDISLGDSAADSMALRGPAKPGGATQAGDSGIMDAGNPSLETVGSGSGLLDISSDESFFGAQMIEESMGGDGDGAAAMPGDADIFGAGDHAATEEAAPVTSGTSGVTFGTTQLAEARDPAFSGFAAGAMMVAALGLVAMAWATIEIALGGYSQVGKMVTENTLMVLGGLGVGVLVAGGIGFGIGKATA